MFLYKNIPTGKVPDTPAYNDLNIGAKTELAKHQETIMNKYAKLVSYKEECNGSLFQDIIPISSLSGQQTSTSSETPIKEYAKNLKMPGYNNIISRQLLIKFEEEQMKQQEMFLNMQEDLIDQEIRHAHVKKEHEEFVKRKVDVLEERRRSVRQLKGLSVRHTQMYDQS
jgi:hypothetical protein